MRIRRRDGWALCLTEDVDRMSGRRKIYQITSHVRWKSSPGITSAHLRLPKQIHGGPEPLFEGSDLTPSTIKSSVMAALSCPQLHTSSSNIKKKKSCLRTPYAWPFSPFLFTKTRSSYFMSASKRKLQFTCA